jgi:hypothetical protein
MDLIRDTTLQPLLIRGFGNELGCLLQGIGEIQGTNTCLFFYLTNIPKERQITYGKILCDYKPHKKENKWAILTVGGERSDYSGEVATSTADITTFKILVNSTLYTENVEMMMMVIKYYYFIAPSR